MHTMIPLATLAACLATAPAGACSLAVSTTGLLALNTTGTVLRSDVLPGAPATLTAIIPALTNVTVTVGPPSVSGPPGYSASGQVPEVSYNAATLALLPVANQAYTTQQTSFGTGILGIASVTVSMTLNNRVTNTNGFASGNYTTQTVVTCSP